MPPVPRGACSEDRCSVGSSSSREFRRADVLGVFGAW
jgi:hypothetical protein